MVKEDIGTYNMKKLEKIRYIEDVLEGMFQIEPNKIKFSWQPTVFSISIDKVAKLEIVLEDNLDIVEVLLYVFLDKKVIYIKEEFNLERDLSYNMMKFFNHCINEVKDPDILIILMVLVENIKISSLSPLYEDFLSWCG